MEGSFFTVDFSFHILTFGAILSKLEVRNAIIWIELWRDMFEIQLMMGKMYVKNRNM